MERRKMGGEILNYDRAAAFSIIPGIEILYFNKEHPKPGEEIHSVLVGNPSTVVMQKSSAGDFCMIYHMGKHLPIPFIKFGCDIVFLINTDLVQKEDMQAFPAIWDFIQDMPARFQLLEQFPPIRN